MYGARQRSRRWGIAHVNRLMGFLASRKYQVVGTLWHLNTYFVKHKERRFGNLGEKSS